MNAIIAVLALGAIVWALTLLAGRLSPTARIPLGTAIMLGLAGYLLVGRPGIPSSPVRTVKNSSFGEEITDPRNGMAERFGPAAQWIGLSDGFARAGRTQLAAQTLEKGLLRYPRNVDLWVALGNALVAHSGGVMTPASAMAFDRAADIDPRHPAPPFFAGLALAQGGDTDGARAVWQELLARSPADAPYRSDLEARLAQLPPAAAPAAPAAGGGAAAADAAPAPAEDRRP